jgi:hypothetical protein
MSNPLIPSDQNEKSGKKVEFSPTLGSIEQPISNNVEGNTNTWDTETGSFIAA